MSKEKVKSVEFSQEPVVFVRVIHDYDTNDVKTNKKKYPFELKNTLKVTVITTKNQFSFIIPSGYTWNGADIPRIFWRIIGSRTDNDFLVASMVHDYMLEFKYFILNEVLKNKMTVKEYRRITSLVFREKIKSQGTNTIKANVMAWCVDVFQIFNKRSWQCL